MASENHLDLYWGRGLYGRTVLSHHSVRRAAAPRFGLKSFFNGTSFFVRHVWPKTALLRRKRHFLILGNPDDKALAYGDAVCRLNVGKIPTTLFYGQSFHL